MPRRTDNATTGTMGFEAGDAWAEGRLGGGVVDAIGNAHVQILRTQAAINELRLFYWMTAAFLVVGVALCLGAIAYGWAELIGRAPVARGTDGPTMIGCAAVALPFVVWLTVSRMVALSPPIAAMRRQQASLEKATARAEEESRRPDDFVLASLWTADAQVALARGDTRDAARDALIAAHPGMTPAQIAAIDFIEVVQTDDGEWTAVVDGN